MRSSSTTYFTAALKLMVCVVSLVAAGCSVNTTKDASSIKGHWAAIEPDISYITLNFADSTAVFDNRGDTINRFSYTVDRATHTLLLTDPLHVSRPATIVKLTNDSLVVNHLWNSDVIQRFYKSKK